MDYKNGHRDWNMHAFDENPDVLLAALERASEAILIVDNDLRVNHFNAAAELIWGMDRAEVLGRLEERPARALQDGGLRGSLALSRLGPAHVVDRLAGELHDMEGVEGDLGLGSAGLRAPPLLISSPW